MEIISSAVSSSSSTRQKISSSSDDNNNIFTFQNIMKNNNDDHKNVQQHSEEDNHTAFEFKLDHHQSANSNSDSPGSPFKDSPADHLFRNGILLPHLFPVQPMCYYYYGSERRSYSYQRSASRTSSVGSKDSLLSSRSNSTNSRSSSCNSSARTSVSDTNSDRKLFYNNAMREYHKKRPQPVVLDQVYGSSRRWQFITPMPVMTQETISSRPKKQKLEPQEHVTTTTTKKVRTKKKTSATASGSCSWPILRFFRYIMSVCRECHALEPSVRSVSSIHEISSQ